MRRDQTYIIDRRVILRVMGTHGIMAIGSVTLKTDDNGMLIVSCKLKIPSCKMVIESTTETGMAVDQLVE